MRRAIESLLGTSPTASIVGDWTRLNDEIRWITATATAAGSSPHSCTQHCCADARHVVRCVLNGNTSSIIIDIVPEEGRTNAELECLKLRVMRLCRNELGLSVLRDVSITRLQSSLLVSFELHSYD